MFYLLWQFIKTLSRGMGSSQAFLLFCIDNRISQYIHYRFLGKTNNHNNRLHVYLLKSLYNMHYERTITNRKNNFIFFFGTHPLPISRGQYNSTYLLHIHYSFSLLISAPSARSRSSKCSYPLSSFSTPKITVVPFAIRPANTTAAPARISIVVRIAS